MKLALAAALWFSLLLGGCGQEPDPPSTAPQIEAESSRSPSDPYFEDRSSVLGLHFEHVNGARGEFHIAELIGAGGALFDVEGDGDLDIYLVQSGSLTGPREERGDHFYLNEGTPREPLYRLWEGALPKPRPEAQVPGYGMGITAADYDRDGDVDLYRSSLGQDQLLRAEVSGGDIRFEDVTAAAGLVLPGGLWSVASTFFDFDQDGWLDLFISGYLDLPEPGSRDENIRCTGPSGHRDYCGAALFPAEQDWLFRNLGDGRFEDVSERVGLRSLAPGRALGTAAHDLDGDGWLDLLVANDASANFLWRGGSGGFEETALLAGVALNGAGKAEASMGVAIEDLDGDGDDEILLTHLIVETHTLYLGRGNLLFDDGTAAAGLSGPTRDHTGFGVAFLDIDDDGDLDLYVANGAVQNISSLLTAGDPRPFHEVDQLFLAESGAAGGIRYREVEPATGTPLMTSTVGRGVAKGDLDGDGDLDLLVTENGGPARLLINRGGPARWLGLHAVDDGISALGSRAGLRLADGSTRWRRVATDGSYGSASDPRVVFALPDAEQASAVVIRWPDGIMEEFALPELGRYHDLRRGSGKK